MLGERFREDRLGLTASSLTFTTTIALVPFFTVALALFTAFPMFAKMQGRVQRWLIESLMPDNIARQVLGYLTQFASKASGLGIAGLVVLLVTAIALILTIDRTLNNIWRVRTPRPLAQRVLIYWAAITLGPLVLALSLTHHVLRVLGLARRWSAAAGAQAVVRHLRVRAAGRRHGRALPLRAQHPREVVACAGRRRCSWPSPSRSPSACWPATSSLVPTYSVLYGAFATLPILLVWIYVAWVIVLLGAVIAAYLPSLLSRRGAARRHAPAGRSSWRWRCCSTWHAAQATPAKGLGAAELVARMRVDALQLAPVLETLVALSSIRSQR